MAHQEKHVNKDDTIDVTIEYTNHVTVCTDYSPEWAALWIGK